jgi:uncharacterized membrane protein YgcG
MRTAAFMTFSICAFVLSACDTPNDFGTAVRTNIAAETVHPGAPLTKQPQRMNGMRADMGQQRYTTDKIKPPDDFELSGINTGSGNGGGNSGGSSSSSSGGGTSP